MLLVLLLASVTMLAVPSMTTTTAHAEQVYCKEQLTIDELIKLTEGDNPVYNMVNIPGDSATIGDDLVIVADDHTSLINGDNGNDCIIGGAGDNTLIGQGGNDWIYGNGGNDVIYGDWAIYTSTGGNDHIYGGAGDDKLYGEYGDDYIVGGPGTDTIDDTQGNNTIHQNDEPVTKEPTGPTYCRENLTIDKLIGLTFEIGDKSYNVYNVIDRRDDTQPVIRGTAGNDLILVHDNGAKVLGKTGSDCIIGGGGDDTLNGGGDGDHIHGGAGDDSIFGAAGYDFLYGMGGNDTIRGHDGNDYIVGGPGTDALYGNKGWDTLIGDLDDTRIAGGADTDSCTNTPSTKKSCENKIAP